jgi:hypothetical protein
MKCPQMGRKRFVRRLISAVRAMRSGMDYLRPPACDARRVRRLPVGRGVCELAPPRPWVRDIMVCPAVEIGRQCI